MLASQSHLQDFTGWPLKLGFHLQDESFKGDEIPGEPVQVLLPFPCNVLLQLLHFLQQKVLLFLQELVQLAELGYGLSLLPLYVLLEQAGGAKREKPRRAFLGIQRQEVGREGPF